MIATQTDEKRFNTYHSTTIYDALENIDLRSGCDDRHLDRNGGGAMDAATIPMSFFSGALIATWIETEVVQGMPPLHRGVSFWVQ